MDIPTGVPPRSVLRRLPLPLVLVSLAGDRMATIDPRQSAIIAFDSAGQLERRFGRSGDGPGELRRPTHIASAGDILLVTDAHGWSRFLVDGTYLDRMAQDTRPVGSPRGTVDPPGDGTARRPSSRGASSLLPSPAAAS
jgi:hypothetical protein